MLKNNISKSKKFISAVLAAIMCAAAFTGCGASDDNTSAGGTGAKGDIYSKNIYVVSREEGSGTRDSFTELTGVQENAANGEKFDNTTLGAEITSSTSVMMTTVAGNVSAIGYISLGSMNGTVKALKINGVEATAENIKNGSYPISRPFSIVTKKSGISAAAQDFIDYILSSNGQAEVASNKYVTVDEGSAYQKKSKISGTVKVGGSSSVTPLMQRLAEKYMQINPDVTIEVEQSDSTTGINSAINGVFDIGMSSRALKDSEISQGVKETAIAMDGIAVIVNNANPLEDAALDTIKSVFTGETASWGEIL